MLKLAFILASVAVCYGQLPDVLYTLHKKDGSHMSMSVSQTITDIDQFEASIPTIFLIPGYAGNSVLEFNDVVQRAIFNSTEEFNVIQVNWISLASGSYTQASGNVGDVAINLDQFIRWLTTDPDPTASNVVAKAEDIHLVGFDLGAHVAGIAGRKLKIEKKEVGRITGLNPSGRHWSSGSQRLKSSDASYVEVIHTDSFGAFANGIGDPIGKVNFYANGGNNQPGCLVHSCCHNRAFELFAASITNKLEGLSCSSMTLMNLNLCRGSPLHLGGLDDKEKNGDLSGIYRINTSRKYPFQ